MVKWLNILRREVKKYVRLVCVCIPYHIYIGIPNSAMLIRSLLVFSHIFSDFDRYDFSCILYFDMDIHIYGYDIRYDTISWLPGYAISATAVLLLCRCGVYASPLIVKWHGKR